MFYVAGGQGFDPPFHLSRDLMKPAKSFIVKSNATAVVRSFGTKGPLWDPKQLRSAMHAVEESQDASEIDPKLTQGK